MDFSAVTASLENHGYVVKTFATAEAASEYLNAQIDKTTVGFGGSVTLKEMNLFDSLSTHNQVFNHWRVPDGMTADEVRDSAAVAEVYVSSVNGVAETGEIVNIDGTGNRVASMIYGHKRLYLVVGRNKIAPTYDDALWRARNIAAPKNAARLGIKTPCAVNADHCYNCKSPQRICNVLSVFWNSIKTCKTEIILIDQDLGY